MIIHHQDAPGFVRSSEPDRYPTRATWPRPGTTGHHKGRSVTLLTIWHQYYATFQTGPASTMSASLQDFIVWPFQNNPVPWTPAETRAAMPEALL